MDVIISLRICVGVRFAKKVMKRSSFVAELGRSIAVNGVRFIAVVGGGGSGKTWLAALRLKKRQECRFFLWQSAALRGARKGA
jgi:ABC-type glutathione transport system ATPase component